MLSEGDYNFSCRQEKPAIVKIGIFALTSRTLHAYVYKHSQKTWTQRAAAPSSERWPGLKAWLSNGQYLCSHLHPPLPSSFGRGEVNPPSRVICAVLQHLESCQHGWCGWCSWFGVGSWRSGRGDRQALFPIKGSPFVSILLPLVSIGFCPLPLPCEGCEVFLGPNAG